MKKLNNEQKMREKYNKNDQQRSRKIMDINKESQEKMFVAY